MNLIFPLSMILFSMIGIGIMFFLMKRNNSSAGRRDDAKKLAAKKSAQEFMNVRDIIDTILFTEDGYDISYIKVQTISLDLLSKNEKKVLTKKLTEEFSDLMDPFKFIAVSRPIDIAPLISEYMEILNTSSDPIQKELLRNETRVMSEFSLSGEVVQREFYYMLWEKSKEYAEEDLTKRAKDFTSKLENAGLKAELLKKPGIIRLVNLINNPAYAAIEDTNVEAIIPMLN